ncbi:MAG TPA: class I SAM-dependent methyltransferase [Acidimicrobiales bacterium]|nr:class I SAM-dependent methyltransferase [Acidimicrobiales bacterium]
MPLSRRRSLLVIGGIAACFLVAAGLGAVIEHAHASFVVDVAILGGLVGGCAGLGLVYSYNTSREVRHLKAEFDAATGLTPLLGSTDRLVPTMGGMAMDAEPCHHMLTLISRYKPTTIVEFGPGTSTVLIQLMLRSLHAPGRIFCIEHDPHFALAVRENLDYFGFGSDEVTVIEAPLAPRVLVDETTSHSWQGKWYLEEALEALPGQVDFVVVDGPPDVPGVGLRYPALPWIKGRLSDRAVIFADDTNRVAERRMIERWLEDPDVSVCHRGGSFTSLLFRRSADEPVGEKTD